MSKVDKVTIVVRRSISNITFVPKNISIKTSRVASTSGSNYSNISYSLYNYDNTTANTTLLSLPASISRITQSHPCSIVHKTRSHYSFSFLNSSSDLQLSSSNTHDSVENPGSNTRHNYTFLLGATGIPKNSNKIPLPDKSDYLSVSVGDDAYFTRHDSIGVADGVGGWKGVRGANPSLFSRKLMHYAFTELDKYDNIEDDEFVNYYKIDPVQILQKSYEKTMKDARKLGLKGSSTACIAILRDDELRIANLGDCGVSIIRHGNIVFRSEEQQHSFNFPYQLGTGSSDYPSDAKQLRIKVQKGDIIIVGSDGLFDNLFDEDILDEVCKHIPQESSKNHPTALAYPTLHINPKKVSEAIARRAKLVSEESRYASSPFQSRAIQEGLYYQGGKVDDISVVVAIVKDLEDSPDRR